MERRIAADRRRRRCSPARRGRSLRQGPKPRGWRNRRCHVRLPRPLLVPCKDFCATIPSHFDREYVNNAVVPRFSSEASLPASEPILPMIDLPLTKQDAIPWDFWGHALRGLEADPSDGATVFLEGLENRTAIIICASASISAGSRPTFTTLRNIRQRLSTFSTSFSI